MLSRTTRLATSAIFRTTNSNSIRRYTTTPFLRASTPTPTTSKKPHTPDTYKKDIDSTPPPDPQVHRIDANSDKVQKPYEPPSGEYSKAGVKTGEYQSVYKIGDAQYEVNGECKEGENDMGERLRYGGKERLEKEDTSSRSGEGPEGKDAGGRKAEDQ